MTNDLGDVVATVDIAELMAFYGSPLGRTVGAVVGQRLARIWPARSGERVVGLGYALPFLPRDEDCERVLAMMPATLGVTGWPPAGKVRSALVHEDDLPLPDASVDRLLVVHALEHTRRPREMLRESWRVLAPGGRLVVVVPNRSGLWARSESTPFGVGEPYSRRQLGRLLENSLFTPTNWGEALFVPPRPRRTVGATAHFWEGLGSRFWPAFAGVILVEAEKRMRQGLPAGGLARGRTVLVPAGASSRELATLRLGAGEKAPPSRRPTA